MTPEFIAEQRNIHILDGIAMVSTLREAAGAIVVLQALLEISADEWKRAYDANNGTHLIKDNTVGSLKSDAIFTYISKVVKTYLSADGVRSTAWTKNTISGENFTTKTIAGILAGTPIHSHEELFRPVASRLLGFDDQLIEAAISGDSLSRATALVTYLASRFDLSQSKEDILNLYDREIHFIDALIIKQGLTPDFYVDKIRRITEYLNSELEHGDPHVTNPLSLLRQE